MTVRHIRGSEDWYIISRDRVEGGRQRWQDRAWSLHGPKVHASVETNLVSRHGFGYGFRFGRNGCESDVGLDIYVGRLASVWLRVRSPWSKWARAGSGSDVRHTTAIVGGDPYWVNLELDSPGDSMRRPRRFTITKYDVFGPTDCETIEGEGGITSVPMPEGTYPATWKTETRTVTYRRLPGTIIDRIKGSRTWSSVDLDIPGGIPSEGKGENPWDCGMDGLFGCSGRDLPDAIANAVRSVLRDRKRHGGPHNLTGPTSVAEADR